MDKVLPLLNAIKILLSLFLKIFYHASSRLSIVNLIFAFYFFIRFIIFKNKNIFWLTFLLILLNLFQTLI
ncbi:hypothetical protein CBW42_12345 [Butyricicoccus porcorum]|uniref:Uncharacterized protein n=1 Tax=Butyricicoccus porcorum TaxID=1945634 RepID=A0A252F157_9FIRM|nr:hypothetical protein CBW42_12345 [Butyricicoccus porcorum]